MAISTQNMPSSFLPVREGISRHKKTGLATRSFPPCTGGCIVILSIFERDRQVSSLYRRVYHDRKKMEFGSLRFLPVREGVSDLEGLEFYDYQFPPCTGGCIEGFSPLTDLIMVSSLYGRVYPCHVACDINRKQKKGDKNV